MPQTMIGAGRDAVLDEVMAGVPRQLIEAETTLYDGDVQPRDRRRPRAGAASLHPMLSALNAAGQTARWRQQ
jgi:hypothetical protein